MKYTHTFHSNQSKEKFTLTFSHTHDDGIFGVLVYQHRGDLYCEVLPRRNAGQNKTGAVLSVNTIHNNHRFTVQIGTHAKGCEVIIVETCPIVIVHESNLQPYNDINPTDSY